MGYPEKIYFSEEDVDKVNSEIKGKSLDEIRKICKDKDKFFAMDRNSEKELAKAALAEVEGKVSHLTGAETEKTEGKFRNLYTNPYTTRAQSMSNQTIRLANSIMDVVSSGISSRDVVVDAIVYGIGDLTKNMVQLVRELELDFSRVMKSYLPYGENPVSFSYDVILNDEVILGVKVPENILKTLGCEILRKIDSNGFVVMENKKSKPFSAGGSIYEKDIKKMVSGISKKDDKEHGLDPLETDSKTLEDESRDKIPQDPTSPFRIRDRKDNEEFVRRLKEEADEKEKNEKKDEPPAEGNKTMSEMMGKDKKAKRGRKSKAEGKKASK